MGKFIFGRTCIIRKLEICLDKKDLAGVFNLSGLYGIDYAWNEFSITKTCQPITIVNPDSSICICVDQSLFFE